MPTSDGRPVIYLIGSTGHPNYGDELIAAGWLRHWAHTMPEAQVWLDSPRPGQTAVLLDGIHPGLRCVDTLFHACWNAPEGSAGDLIAHGRRVVDEPGIIPREATGVENLSQVDLVHIVGGGYLNAYWPHHLSLLGAAQRMAQRYGTRTAITGAGLTPLVPDSAEVITATLADFDIVDVRDEASFDLLADAVAHLSQTGDDAFLGIDDVSYDRRNPARTALCLQSDLLEVPLESIADYVVRTLRAWGVDGERVTLVECLPPKDVEVLSLLQPHLPRLEVLPFSQLWRVGIPSGPTQRWISTRFHPHLVGAARGTWGVALPVSHGYYQNKHRSLVDLGSGWTIAPDFGDPVEPQSSASPPYGGELPAIRQRKADIAVAVTALVGSEPCSPAASEVRRVRPTTTSGALPT